MPCYDSPPSYSEEQRLTFMIKKSFILLNDEQKENIYKDMSKEDILLSPKTKVKILCKACKFLSKKLMGSIDNNEEGQYYEELLSWYASHIIKDFNTNTEQKEKDICLAEAKRLGWTLEGKQYGWELLRMP